MTSPGGQPQMRAARVRVDQLVFHPKNVRRDLGDLRELAASIRQLGVLEPLIVEDRPGRGRVLAGHRRLAAARIAGLRTVPVLLVPEVADDVAIVTMVSENRHRAALSPAEKTTAARMLRDEHGYSQAKIAERLGVHQVTVSRWLSGADEGDGPSKMDTAPATRDGLIAKAQARAAARKAGVGKPAKPGGHRKVVSVSHLRTLADEWEGRAPAALLRELRGLAGDPPTGPTPVARGRAS